MAKLDHHRPILKLIDDIKRRRAVTRVSKVRKRDPDAKIGSVARRGNALDVAVHRAGCDVLAHVDKHSDVRMVDRLLEGVPNIAQRRQLRAWFAAFGPVDFVGGNAKYRRGATTALGKAMHKPFWSFEAER
jgi:hypothetical protein